jgi:hypothetical protein
MTDLQEEAYRVVIEAERRSLELYRHWALMLDDVAGREILARLAGEESRILARIMERHTRCAPDLGCPGGGETAGFGCQAAQAEAPLLEVLRLALQEKAAAVGNYQACLGAFRDPALCEIFELAFALSRDLLRKIIAEYRLADHRLQRPAPGRRPKRNHIRSWSHNGAAPNQHSQLSVFLRDLGRRSPS